MDCIFDNFAVRNSLIRNKENGNPKQGMHLLTMRYAVLCFRTRGKRNQPTLGGFALVGSERNATIADRRLINLAVLEFVIIGTVHTTFLSGSVKGGGHLAGSSDVLFQLLARFNNKPDNHISRQSIIYDVRSLGAFLRS